MGNFGTKIEAFNKIFIGAEGYKTILEGLKNTLLIAVIGLIMGIIIGTVLASMKTMPQYTKTAKLLNGLSGFYVALFRGTPIVVQLLIFYYVILPLMNQNMTSLNVACIVFGLNSGAYVCEIMRAGIQSVDVGQMEGGRAVGLPYSVAMRKIIIPQAIKNILPTLGNEFITLIKNTSVVSFVGAMDLYVAFRNIGSSNYEFMVPYIVMAGVYIVVVLIITAIIKLVENSLKKSDRSSK